MKSTVKSGFTLIELLMVIAIIAIISTLAVNKVGGIRESSARKVSLANQKAVERAVESFLVAGGQLNRLDGLFDALSGGSELGSGNGFDFARTNEATTVEGGLYFGPLRELGAYTREELNERNAGLMTSLANLIVPYSLSQSEVDALTSRIGLKYVMQHNIYGNPEGSNYKTPYAYYRKGDDGTVPQALDGMDANNSAVIARAVTNRMYVAAISPVSDLGRTIYQAMGQELMNTAQWGERYDETTAVAEVKRTGGALLAFGLGESASIIGKANAGLESAPYATFPLKRYYTRYILLFRVRTAGAGSVSVAIPEFAGVLDCEGNTIRAAQHILNTL